MPEDHDQKIRAHTFKTYACDRCGHEEKQRTNHYGPTWSAGRSNTCPICPPWAKYPEFAGRTTWTCKETPPEETIKHLAAVLPNWRFELYGITGAIACYPQAHKHPCRAAWDELSKVAKIESVCGPLYVVSNLNPEPAP